MGEQEVQTGERCYSFGLGLAGQMATSRVGALLRTELKARAELYLTASPPVAQGKAG
ncbi:hypothetical protein GE21DRAFT_1205744 [Neurospora crassa]|nr:hypothetical protein GE21DRAFT_1205744 [Neurospora crassa]